MEKGNKLQRTGPVPGTKDKVMTTIETHFGAKVECEIKGGIGIHVIGVPDNQVSGMLLYVVTCLQSIGYTIPGKKFIINVVGYDGTNWRDLVFYVGCAILKEAGKLVL